MIDMSGNFDAFLESYENSAGAGGSSDTIEDDFLLPLWDFTDAQLDTQLPLPQQEDGSAKSEVQSSKSKRERKREADREFRRRKRDKIERLTVSHATLMRESQELKRQIRELTALVPSDALLLACKSAPHSQSHGHTQSQTQAHQQLVTSLVDAFNAGAIEQMQHVIEHAFHPDCVLLTPAVFEELHGHQAMAKFWRVVLEAFPDGMIEATSTNVEQDGEQFHLRFQFHGTKVAKMPTDMLLKRWQWIGASDRQSSKRPRTSRSGDGSVSEPPESKVDLAESQEVTQPTPRVSLFGHMLISFRDHKVSRLLLLWNTMALLSQITGTTESEFLKEMQGEKPITVSQLFQRILEAASRPRILQQPAFVYEEHYQLYAAYNA